MVEYLVHGGCKEWPDGWGSYTGQLIKRTLSTRRTEMRFTVFHMAEDGDGYRVSRSEVATTTTTTTRTRVSGVQSTGYNSVQSDFRVPRQYTELAVGETVNRRWRRRLGQGKEGPLHDWGRHMIGQATSDRWRLAKGVGDCVGRGEEAKSKVSKLFQGGTEN
ncbi:hypothetical protein GQ44DRAFT_491539 [Phaeosphaeriaceae sp. PMI808]|nr:hypothetical protein GQ44DRAFT_491539 [Phaeosphaeriaceae sp. PMI808]